MLRLEGVSAGYGPVQVLLELSLEAQLGRSSRFWGAMARARPRR